MARGLNRTLAGVALLLAVAGCNSNTAFRMNSANQTYAANNGLYVLLAKADLGLITGPASFKDTAGTYAEIIAGFEMGRSVPIVGRFSTATSRAATRDSLDASIARCVGQVTAMSERHRRAGIAAGSELIGTVRAACNAAAQAVAEQETASLVLTTFAQDL